MTASSVKLSSVSRLQISQKPTEYRILIAGTYSCTRSLPQSSLTFQATSLSPCKTNLISPERSFRRIAGSESTHRYCGFNPCVGLPGCPPQFLEFSWPSTLCENGSAVVILRNVRVVPCGAKAWRVKSRWNMPRSRETMMSRVQSAVRGVWRTCIIRTSRWRSILRARD